MSAADTAERLRTKGGVDQDGCLVLKTLGLLQSNPRHPGLHTHKYDRFTGPNGEDVFAAYVENRTPAAYRLFFCYGPERGQITVLAITQHP